MAEKLELFSKKIRIQIQEFVGLVIKKRTIEGENVIGALYFTQKLDDMIEWGDNDTADNNDGKLIVEKRQKAREINCMDRLAVAADVVQEIVTMIDLMNNIKGYSLKP